MINDERTTDDIGTVTRIFYVLSAIAIVAACAIVAWVIT